MPEKLLQMHGPEIVQENVRKIGELFPEALTESTDENGTVKLAIDFDILKQKLSDCIAGEKEEPYRFTWPEKRNAIFLANSPSRKKLCPCEKESLGKDGTPGGFDSENLYIEGDNLDVLKLLQSSYSGKIKMIYIDPPYNTGNDFVYSDDFSEDVDSYLERSGQIGENENSSVLNAETDGRFHTAWLNMIYPRLKIARNLLEDDGVIFISIDEGEIDNLKKICNEIFNEKNFINTFMWLHGKGKKDSWSRTLQQYVVAYAKNKSVLEPWIEKKICDYKFKNPDDDPKGPWFSGSLSFNEKRSNPKSEKYYSVKSPGGVVWTRQWMVKKDEMERLIADGDIFFGKAPAFDAVPRRKIRPGATIEVIPNNIIDDCNTTRGAEGYLTDLFGCDCFSYPKPYELILKLASFLKLENATVLDFFAGSSTTAESVMRMNVLQKNNAKFIMVQLQENLDEALKTASSANRKIIQNAINYLDSKNLHHDLCEIGKERIRLAAKKMKKENSDCKIDFGFKVFKLDDSNDIECHDI